MAELFKDVGFQLTADGVWEEPEVTTPGAHGPSGGAPASVSTPMAACRHMSTTWQHADTVCFFLQGAHPSLISASPTSNTAPPSTTSSATTLLSLLTMASLRRKSPPAGRQRPTLTSGALVLCCTSCLQDLCPSRVRASVLDTGGRTCLYRHLQQQLSHSGFCRKLRRKGPGHDRPEHYSAGTELATVLAEDLTTAHVCHDIASTCMARCG